MTICRSTLWGLVTAVGVSACTLSPTETPSLTGPSTFATSVSVTATPDVLSLGQFRTSPGQQSEIVVRAFDANGQPKANQIILLDTVVNGQLSGCGQLSVRSVTTGSDGLARAVFTAPGTPPNCPNFNIDSTVGVRATPVGSQASTAAASTANIVMALPTLTSSPGALVANIGISVIEGIRNFQFDGSSSVSPGHTIVSYAWRFSDGHTEVGRIIDHDFPLPGTYFVTLTVRDEISQESFKTALVTAN